MECFKKNGKEGERLVELRAPLVVISPRVPLVVISQKVSIDKIIINIEK